jgi:predicted transcriptional regulator
MTERTTIKLSVPLRDRIAALAERRGVTMGELLERMVERAETAEFFAELDEDLSRLRDRNPEEWEAYRRESRDWEDATIGDGLGDA